MRKRRFTEVAEVVEVAEVTATADLPKLLLDNTTLHRDVSSVVRAYVGQPVWQALVQTPTETLFMRLVGDQWIAQCSTSRLTNILRLPQSMSVLMKLDDGELVVTCLRTQTSFKLGIPLHMSPYASPYAYSMSFSRDGQLGAFLGEDTIHLWNRRDNSVQDIPLPAVGCTLVQLHSDWLYAIYLDVSYRMDPQSIRSGWKPVRRLTRSRATGDWSFVSRNGRWLIRHVHEGVEFTSVDGRQVFCASQLLLFGRDKPVKMTTSASGKYCAAFYSVGGFDRFNRFDGIIRIFAFGSFELLWEKTLLRNSAIVDVVFSEDDTEVFIAFRDVRSLRMNMHTGRFSVIKSPPSSRLLAIEQVTV